MGRTRSAVRATTTNTTIALNLTAEVRRFIENMGLFYESYGIPRIGGRIVGLMLVADGPLSAEQIASALRISRASVSTNLRTLGLLNLIDQVGILGDRRDYYLFSPQAWEQAILARIEGMQGLAGIAEQGLGALPDNHPGRKHITGMLRWTQHMAAADRRALDEWRAQDEAEATTDLPLNDNEQ